MFNNSVHRSHAGTRWTMVAAATVLFAGCTANASPGGNDKAGGSVDPVVLRLANTSFDLERHPALQYFVDRVKELSGGALRIEVAQLWGDNAADAEQQVVRAVADGTIQLGSVGTQVFDTVGVLEFQALTAPMLIDNYPLQQAVLDSDIPGEMLAGLDKIGLDGIAVLGDGLRKPIAVAHPLLGPADYEGITFEAFRSQGHADAIRALGATPTDTLPEALLRDGTIDGFEKGLRIYKINQSEFVAPYVTANVNLWPHTLALIANPHTIDDLSTQQRGWLTKAGADATSRSTDLSDDDTKLIVELCATGARFANASDADLAALRGAFDTVYATLSNDPTTKDFIDRIDRLKQSSKAGPALEIPSGCTGQAPLTPPGATGTTVETTTALPVATELDGTYRWTLTKDDAVTFGLPNLPPEVMEAFPAVFTMVMDGGTMELRHRDGDGDIDDGGGSYTIDGDQIVFAWVVQGYESTYTFSVDDDGTVHLEPEPTNPLDEQFVMSTNPWTKIADAPGNPAVSLSGSYRWTITKDDALAYGTPNDRTPEALATFPTTFTVTMTDETWTMSERGAGVVQEDGSGSYRVSGDQVIFNWGTNVLTFTFTVDTDGTMHLAPQPPMEPGDQFIWATEPWGKVG